MHPVLLEIGRFRIFSYGTMIALGGILTVWFWLRHREGMGLKEEHLWLLVNVILACGFIGGRLLYVLEYSRQDLFSINRGFSVLGAFISVFLGVYFFCRAVKASFLRVLDYVCLGAPLWHAFGRVGCFLAGCCYGKPTTLPWGVVFTDPGSMVEHDMLGLRLHPTQLYESVGTLIIFAGLLLLVLPRLESGKLKQGSLAAFYFGSYAILRFFLEFLRADAVPTDVLGLTAGQWLCVAVFGCALAIKIYASHTDQPRRV